MISAILRGLARMAGDLREDVRRGRVEDLLRGVKPETVEMKFVDPVTGVGDEELAHRRGISPSKLIASPHSFS